MQNIRISQILDDLERGLSRESISPDYNPELGCIKDKYDLTNKELKYLFDHPKLKGKRTKLPVMFNLIDDTVPQDDITHSWDTVFPGTGGGLIEAMLNSSNPVADSNPDSLASAEQVSDIVESLVEEAPVREATSGENW